MAPLEPGAGQPMAAGEVSSDTVAVSVVDSPRLAGDFIPSYDERMEDLLQGQQEVLSLVLAGGTLEQILGHIVAVVECAFAPAQCVVSLVRRDEGAVCCRAATQLPPELLSTVGVAIGDYLLDPAASAVRSRERIVVDDFSADRRWPEHAELALAHGLRCCWAEPVPDCGEGLVGVAALYYPQPRAPNAGDLPILR